MRRTLLILALLVFGCARAKPPASESSTPGGPAGGTAAISLADVTGTWDGTVTRENSDTVLTNVELTGTAAPTGWTLRVTSAGDPSRTTLAPVANVVAAGDSLVVEAGPYASVLRAGQQVSTHGVYRLVDGKLVGTIRATYPASGETILLHSVSTRKTK
jgi:hypothetical protein